MKPPSAEVKVVHLQNLVARLKREQADTARRLSEALGVRWGTSDGYGTRYPTIDELIDQVAARTKAGDEPALPSRPEEVGYHRLMAIRQTQHEAVLPDGDSDQVCRWCWLAADNPIHRASKK